MPRKTLADLTNNHRVGFKWEFDENAKALSVHIMIQLLPPPDQPPLDVAAFLNDLKAQGTAIEQCSFEGHDSHIRVACDGHTWVVLDSHAPNGWGPLLYDLAIELATLKGTWLRSSHEKVSDDALKIWIYYFENRNDIESSPLEEAECNLAPTALRNKYRMKTCQLISEIETRGILWQENVFFDTSL